MLSGSLPGGSHGHLWVHFPLGLPIPVLLPLRDHPAIPRPQLPKLLLIPRPPMQNILRLLEMWGLALHVEAAEGYLGARRVVYVELLRAQIHQILIRLPLGKTCRMSCKSAGQFRVKEFQMPSVYAFAFLRVRPAEFQLRIVNAPTTIT